VSPAQFFIDIADHFERSALLTGTGAALLASLAVGGYRLLLVRKRIAWRDYMDDEITLHPVQQQQVDQSGGKLGFSVYTETPNPADPENPTRTSVDEPSMVLLRIRNAGFVSVSGSEINPPLKFVFPGREVRAAQPIEAEGNVKENLLLLPGDTLKPENADKAEQKAKRKAEKKARRADARKSLATRLRRFADGSGGDRASGGDSARHKETSAVGSSAKDFVTLNPEVTINRRDRITAMVLLSGAPSDPKERIQQDEGKIADGHIYRELPRRGLVAIPFQTLALILVPVALLGVTIGQLLTPLPRTTGGPAPCPGGDLTLIGSTAFSPVAKQIADDYAKGCPAAKITVPTSNSGSGAGLGELETRGRQGTADGLIAMSDGPAPPTFHGLRGTPTAIIVYTVIVNSGIPVYDLTASEIRNIFNGSMTSWPVQGSHNVPIRIIGREPGSGSRNTFDRYVLGLPAPAAGTGNCGSDSHPPAVVSCVESTGNMLEGVSALEGAIGYAQTGDVATYAGGGLRAVSLGGIEGRFGNTGPSARNYPFWNVEYLYTYGPATGLASRLLQYLGTSDAVSALEAAGYTPCLGTARGPARTVCSAASADRG
jgi:ABC-type phosphate transport system substrate-binding protein